MLNASKLGCYILPGPALDPTQGIPQAIEAEKLGLGSVWLSELQGPMKDAATICAYVGHSTSVIDVGTSVTHFTTRHPMVLASWGATMQVLTGGRFVIGFGRSAAERWRSWGVPVSTTESMEDYAGILRRLWSHETVSYDGPAGRYPSLSLGEFPDVDPPSLLIAAIGPRTLELAGRAFDGVLLHPFLTPQAVNHSQTIVRDAAISSGRDPAEVTVYAQVVTAPDMSDDEVDAVVRARAAAYFAYPGFGELIVRANGWDPGPLETFRTAVNEEQLKVQGRTALIAPSRVLPADWFSSGSAIGSAKGCGTRLHDFIEAGADEIIIHGVTPANLGRTVEAFSAKG
jgi:5,10-methylenetetrahydromethanopterin reductase